MFLIFLKSYELHCTEYTRRGDRKYKQNTASHPLYTYNQCPTSGAQRIAYTQSPRSHHPTQKLSLHNISKLCHSNFGVNNMLKPLIIILSFVGLDFLLLRSTLTHWRSGLLICGLPFSFLVRWFLC